MTMKNLTVTSWLTMLLAVAVAALPAPSANAQTFTEPATVFYGKVIVTDAVAPFLLTEGTLIWTIQKSDGGTLSLRTSLREVNDGEFSYRLNVPHEALVTGLQLTSSALPLGSVPQTYTHGSVTVEGLPARMIGPSGSAFNAEQALRTAAYRMDLVVSMNSDDIDGDGIPDWWESRFSLDDPNGDADGDGVSNLNEFRRGSNPKRDDRIPTLLTKEVRAMANGTSLVLLRAIDSDSAATALTYTLTRTPDSGVLYRRNSTASAQNPDSILNTNSTFTQADVVAGRIIYVDQSAAITEGASFQVILRDENPAHAASTNTVRLQIYQPRTQVALASGVMDGATPKSLPAFAGFTADEDTYVVSHALSRDLGYVVADGSAETWNLDITLPSSGLTPASYASSYVPSYGPDRHHVLLGGGGNDRLVGSMEGDMISGGAGADRLRGNGGADLFVLANRYDGNDTIEDFDPSENDRIDLSRVLVGTSRSLTNYLRVVNSTSNSLLQINCTGGTPFITDITLTVLGSAIAQQGLFALVDNGNIVTGDKAFAPRISIETTIPLASENGPTSGEFRVTRSGSLAGDLAVNLQITGPAVNGTDYRFVPTAITLPAGQRSVTIQISPYVDAITESAEIVDIAILPGTGYEVASQNNRAQLSIEDLAPLLSIEAVEPIATKSDLLPGTFAITREGIIDRSLLVRLTIGGTAGNGIDYQSISTIINFVPNQTVALVSIVPKPTATLNGGMEYAQITIRTDPAYKVGNPSVARVYIVEEQMNFEIWKGRYFPSANDTLAEFARKDTGNTGFRHLQRYAFGLNPTAPQNSAGVPSFKVRDDHLTVVFRKPVAVTDVQYAVEVSPDLVTWQAGTNYWETFTAPEFASDPQMMGYRARQTMTEMPRLFMRVRLDYAP